MQAALAPAQSFFPPVSLVFGCSVGTGGAGPGPGCDVREGAVLRMVWADLLSCVFLFPLCFFFFLYQAALAPVQVVMYEQVQFSGWFGLMLTVGSQPAVVTISASYAGFQAWTSNGKHVSRCGLHSELLHRNVRS